MKLSLEIKALGWAVLAAGVSLGGTWLLAIPIKAITAGAPAMESGQKTAIDVTPSPERMAEGRRFFEMSCSHCHGDDAHGDEGPDLHNLSLSNTRIATTIKKGIKGEMPTFAKKYDDDQVAALVTYLRSLR